MRKTALILFLITFFNPLLAQEVVLVVNLQNPVKNLSKNEVARIFLKRTKNWPDGNLIIPVDLEVGSNIRDEFSRTILDRPTSSVRIYWQQQIFSGRDISPLELKSEADVIAFVEKNLFAIGYISARTATGQVKKIQIEL